jgi:hypothetical protein
MRAFEGEGTAIMEVFTEIRCSLVVVLVRPMIAFPPFLLDLYEVTSGREKHFAWINHPGAPHFVRRLSRNVAKDK